MRHAKTERSNPDGDHARVLMERGHSDSDLIAGWLAENGIRPDLALVSDAARTRQTMAKLKPALAEGADVRFSGSLYLAPPEAILHEIWATPANAETLLVVGHNPGIHELAFELAGSGERRLRSTLAGGFPTAALAVLDFDAPDWTGVAPGGGELKFCVTAKSLREGTGQALGSGHAG